MRQRLLSSSRKGAISIAVALVGALVLGGCNYNGPTFGESHGADVQGSDIAKLYSGLFIAGLVVAVLVWGLIFWCVIRYRKKKGDSGIPRQFQDNPLLEAMYIVVPLIIVSVIFVFTVITENEVDSVTHPAVAEVTAVAYQWGWEFEYHNANGLVVRTAKGGAPHATPSSYNAPVYPQLVIPNHETTKIVLISNDVVHEFYVHAFDFGRFAQPGVRNQFEFTPTRAGVYPAQCSEFCGLYHSEMLFTVAVVSPRTYVNWLHYYDHHKNVAPAHFAMTKQDQTI